MQKKGTDCKGKAEEGGCNVWAAGSGARGVLHEGAKGTGSARPHSFQNN